MNNDMYVACCRIYLSVLSLLVVFILALLVVLILAGVVCACLDYITHSGMDRIYAIPQ